MAARHKSASLKEARKEIYNFFESKGFVFDEGTKSYLSEAIKNYAAKHNEILMAQMNHLQNSLTRKK